jgi:uncharacterized protein (TIGR02271 family)
MNQTPTLRRNEMAYEKVVAVFDTPEHAQNALRALKAAGFSADDISIMNNETLDDRGAKVATESGFWHRLFGSDVDLHEAKVYGHTVDKGGTVLTLRASDTVVQKAVDILHNHNPVDVNQRAASLGIIAAAAAPIAAATSNLTAKTPAAPTASAAVANTQNNEVIRLAEEQLNVAKRQVQAGMTRVRRFVTEKPVETQVTLHEEHASVARRAITDPSYIKDIDWSDRTIEVTETAEEAVVSKSARVVEEVVVGKEGSDRVETVKDKVRRQQVEVERQPVDPVKKTA